MGAHSPSLARMGGRTAPREPQGMRAQAPIARSARACGLLLTAALAAPALATAAPTVGTDLPCYSTGQPIGLGGAGYTPAGDVAVSFALSGAHGNNLVTAKDPLKADAAGGIHSTLAAPELASDNDLRETVTLTAQDQARIGPTGPIGPPEDSFATTQFTLSAVDVLVLPWLIGHVNPRAQTTFKVMGWEPYRKVYAHYFLNGKRIKTVEIGSVSGPCGDMTKKVRQFPFRPVPAGRYRIRFTGTPFYDPQGFWIGYRDVVVPKAKAVR
jgi:hypothetical protein